MKIGIDVRTLLDAKYSGVPGYTLNLVQAILKLDSENDYRLFSNSLCRSRGLMRTYADLCGKNQSNVELIIRRYPNKILNYFLFKCLGQPKIDRLLDVDIFFMPHINFISLSAGSKKVLTVHDLSFLKFREFFSCRRNFWHKMVNVKKLIKTADKIIAVSENTKNDIIELFGADSEKVEVIYSGIGEEYKVIDRESDSENFNKVIKRYDLPEKFILYLGTLEPRKNVEGVISAYNELRRKGEADYKLVIAGGRGWKSGNIFKAWRQSPYHDDIKFIGYVAEDDKPYIYNLADVFVFPSFYEGFGFPPLEAMACSTPVVASYSSSLGEVLGNAAILVDPYNINDISTALQNILEDVVLREDLKISGLKKAKQYNWQAAAEKYIAVFNNL